VIYVAEPAALDVARVSWGHFLYHDAMARFRDQLASLRSEPQRKGPT
jgi:2-methylisocitrate lyase-like PEP mutase family enzyme